jgi:hypothetical protein
MAAIDPTSRMTAAAAELVAAIDAWVGPEHHLVVRGVARAARQDAHNLVHAVNRARCQDDCPHREDVDR